jgi:ketosteroid isomerase-like protein
MQKIMLALVSAAAVLVSVLQPGSAQGQSPKAVVEALLTAMVQKDAVRIRSLFSMDASQAYGSGAWKTGEVFFRWIETDVITAEGIVDNAELEVAGNDVTVKGAYRNKHSYRNTANFLITVVDGKIRKWHVRY